MSNDDATSRRELLGRSPADDLLDLRYLAEAAEGDAEFIESILHDYVKGTRQHLEELQGALMAHDVEGVSRLAHSIKGASGSVGATRVMEAAAELETHVRLEGMNRTDVLVFAVTSEFRRLESHLTTEGEIASAMPGPWALPA